MVRKRLETGISAKIKLVEELVRVACQNNLPVLKVGDITISTMVRPPSVSHNGIPFTKGTDKAKVVEPNQPTSVEAEDIALFGAPSDYSKV